MRPDRAIAIGVGAGLIFVLGTLCASLSDSTPVKATQLLPLYEIVPVWRFWSPKLEGHFYTCDPNEKTKLIEQYPHVWTYEGVVFGVHGKAPEVQP